MSQTPNAKFNKVVLEGSDFKDKEVVTANYVNAKIDDLVNGASTSFDKLKELSLALSNGEDVAVAVTSQISSLGLSLNSESNARVAYESANDVSISVIQGNVSSLLTSVDSIVTMRLPSLDTSVITLQFKREVTESRLIITSLLKLMQSDLVSV